MRLTGMGKVTIFILVVGMAAGGWRWWQAQQSPGAGTKTGSKGGGGFKLPFEMPKIGKSGGGTGGETGSGGSGSSSDILFIITAAKKDWVGEQVDRFNKVNDGKWRIITKPIPSRDAMHDIISGKEKPVLWSPGSPIWPTRLSEVWSEKNGSSILDMNDPNSYRVFLRSPLVFMTTQRKARFLRPLLGGSEPWLSLRKLSLRQVRTPWSWFRFSHADPLTSSSGMMTLGLILYDYGERTGQASQFNRLATDPKFLTYLTQLEAGLIYDTPAESTTALTKAFLEDASRYDVITGYESAALEAAPRNRELAVIYPRPTAVSEHAVSLLSGDWVTPEQREGALAFLKFLGEKESLQAGLKYHFRPASSSGSLSLANELSQYGGQGFQQTYSEIQLPPYEALNAAAFQWRVKVAKKPAS